MKYIRDSVWITWDDHRRSAELAESFGALYGVIPSSLPRILRYAVLSLKTLIFLNKNKPRIVFCQNPSVVLPVVLILSRKFFRFTLVMDRHSNFKVSKRKDGSLKWKVFHILSDYGLRGADLVIVTNQEASEYVETVGATAAILPDRLPRIKPTETKLMAGERNFLFICTFSDDEPYAAVFEAFSNNDAGFHVYVTGNYSKTVLSDAFLSSNNITFLGFVDDVDYVNYLYSVDAVIVLTDMPMTLNCGSYEAVKAEKPQVVSGSTTIKSYFYKGAVYICEFTPDCISKAVDDVADNYDTLKGEQISLKRKIEPEWSVQFQKIVAWLDQKLRGLES